MLDRSRHLIISNNEIEHHLYEKAKGCRFTILVVLGKKKFIVDKFLPFFSKSISSFYVMFLTTLQDLILLVSHQHYL